MGGLGGFEGSLAVHQGQPLPLQKKVCGALGHCVGCGQEKG